MKHLVSDEWLADQLAKHGYRVYDGALVKTKPKGNPCIPVFGKGPEGKICKHCTHLHRKRYSKTYIKCGLRPNTNGPGTDHKAGWEACGKYEEKPPSTPSAASPEREKDL